MLRKLLACLALLTGLAAAGAPAQAEVAVLVASRLETSAAGAIVVRGQAEVAAARPQLGRHFARAHAARPLSKWIAAAPSVRIGIDRARE